MLARYQNWNVLFHLMVEIAACRASQFQCMNEAYIRWKEKLNVDAKSGNDLEEGTGLLVWLLANVFLAVLHQILAYTCCTFYVTKVLQQSYAVVNRISSSFPGVL